MRIPIFPEHKILTIHDHDFLHSLLWEFQPVVSELTFTNLFMWRNHYKFKWTMLNDTLLILAADSSDPYYFQPVGKRPLKKDILTALYWLHDDCKVAYPYFDRTDRETADECSSVLKLKIEPLRNHFDYLYDTHSLISLKGRNYHAKRNHLNRFKSENQFTYLPLTCDLVDQCIGFSDKWCHLYQCKNNSTLEAEWKAIREALCNFEYLQFKGGVIFTNNNIEAFALGELLNKSTAVIHIEKANTAIHGIYAAINQLFCEHNWEFTSFVNREQDLGEDGLRTAKNSYHPQKMVEKFRITLTV